jgi:hypothetical protein
MANLKYAVGPQGWAAGGYWLDAGAVVDTSVRSEAVFQRPPVDCVPLNQSTYDFFCSQGTVGLGYDYSRVAVAPGVTGINPRAKSLDMGV